jgi:signal transduction histidine kinase
LGFDPTILFEGPVDTVVPDELATDLLATLREALSNVSRHAKASHVDVVVSAGDDLVLRVVDDGVGPPEAAPGRGNGLRNMRTRAEQHGGTAALDPGAPGGSVFEWRIPLRVSGDRSTDRSIDLAD